MEPEWFYKPIEGYNRRYIRVGEFRRIRWCETHESSPRYDVEECWNALVGARDCRIVDKWLEV